MVIKRSQVMGYCYGVSHVIEMAWEALRIAKEKNLNAYTIGWFIHNPTVVKKFEDLNMRPIKSPKEQPAGVALIRAHGIGDPLREEFEKAGYILIDGTCATVAYSQNMIRKSDPKNRVLLLGQRGHSEVTALCNVLNEKGQIVEVTVIETEADVKALDDFGNDEILLMTQTTFAQLQYEKLKNELTEKYKGRLKIGNKLCPTTHRRHKAIIELCNDVDAVLVIGGLMSSNTAALKQLVENEKLPVWHIENEKMIPKEIFQFERVGIAAGTSTPEEDIASVIEALKAGSLSKES